jgi:hypothetical protein
MEGLARYSYLSRCAVYGRSLNANEDVSYHMCHRPCLYLCETSEQHVQLVTNMLVPVGHSQ